MASPVNVSAKISVGFEDQFSAQACQAFELVKKCAEDAFKVMESFPKSLAFGGVQGDIDLFSQAVDKFDSSMNRMNESFIKGQEEASNFGEALENPRELVDKFWESMNQADTFAVITTLTGLTIGLTSLANLNFPLAGLGAAIGIIGLNATFLVSLLSDIEESLIELEKHNEVDFIISEGSIFQLEELSSSLERLTDIPDFQLKVDLQDNATANGAKIRKKLEVLFKPVITQKIVTEQVDAFLKFQASPSTSFGGSSSGSVPDLFFNKDIPDFVTSSPDLTGFGDSVGFSPPKKPSVPTFSSGIERVPRDMLAMIHKDEAVLPKNRAEDFRRVGSSGMTIQRLDFNFNVPNGLKLDREEFRNLAFQMRDELKRLDQRIN